MKHCAFYLMETALQEKNTSYQTPKDKEQVRMYSMENEFYAIYEYRQKEDKYFVVKMF